MVHTATILYGIERYFQKSLNSNSIYNVNMPLLNNLKVLSKAENKQTIQTKNNYPSKTRVNHKHQFSAVL